MSMVVLTYVGPWPVEEGKVVWNGRCLDDWIAELVDGLVRLFDPAEVWLSGSTARGQDGDSVIDIIDAYDSTTRMQRIHSR
jgi:hypothetical protein